MKYTFKIIAVVMALGALALQGCITYIPEEDIARDIMFSANTELGNSGTKALQKYYTGLSKDRYGRYDRESDEIINLDKKSLMKLACSNGDWASWNPKHVVEAKKRSLECEVEGVATTFTVSKKINNQHESSNLFKKINSFSDYVICQRSRWKEESLIYKNEAKNRGLDCKINNDNYSLASTTNKDNQFIVQTGPNQFGTIHPDILCQRTKTSLGGGELRELKRRGYACLGNGKSYLVKSFNTENNVKKEDYAKNWENSYICSMAIDINKTDWSKLEFDQKFVNEAKRRGLDCGVKKSKKTVVANKINSESYSPLKNYSNDLIISYACFFDGFKYTSYKTDIVSKQYVDEAKRRGLDCGAENNKKVSVASKSEITSKSQNYNSYELAQKIENFNRKKQDELNKLGNKPAIFDSSWLTKRREILQKYDILIEEAQRQVSSKTSDIKSKSIISSSTLDIERKKRLKLEKELEGIKNKQKLQQQRIISDNQAPIINAFAKQVNSNAVISGRVTDNTEIAEVLVDGQVQPINPNGTFETKFYIPRSGKTIEIVAYDIKGNKASKLLKIERGNIQQASGPKFDALNPSGKRVKSNPNALALVIGVANYEKTAANALYADKDAQQFYDYATMKLGISPSNIKELVNNKADRVEIALAVKDWIQRSTKQGKSDIYVFFAGHGLATGDGKDMFLLPYDGLPRLLQDSAIKRDQLFADIQQANPRSVTVFLDTCYSGTTRGTDMLIASRPIFIAAKEQSIPDNFTVFSAAAGDQTSKPLEEAKHGMFSYFLMKGMEGDADANNDKKITALELHNYVRENVVQQSSGSQTPELQGDADRVLVQFN